MHLPACAMLIRKCIYPARGSGTMGNGLITPMNLSADINLKTVICAHRVVTDGHASREVGLSRQAHTRCQPWQQAASHSHSGQHFGRWVPVPPLRSLRGPSRLALGALILLAQLLQSLLAPPWGAT